MKVTPYLTFPGNCRQAMEHYASVLNAEIAYLQTHGESPMADEVSDDWRDAVLHAHLVGPGIEIMASDAPPEMYNPGSNVVLALTVQTPGEAERAFEALSEGGKVTMPLQETFWSKLFGMTVDRFGTPWMVDLADPENEGGGDA